MGVHVHMCGWHPLTIPHPHPPTFPPPGGTPGISQNSIVLELIEIFQFCLKILKSVETSPPMGGCIIWCVGGWVGGLMGGVKVKSLKIFKILTESR